MKAAALLALALTGAPLAGQEPAAPAAVPDTAAVGVADTAGAGVPEAASRVPDSLRLGRRLSPAARVELERLLAQGPLVVEGNAHVPPDSAVPGSLLVVGGTLRFEGRAPGSVAVVGGDLFVRPGAEIGGDAVVIGGGLYGSAMATVRGEKRVLRGERVKLLRDPGRITIEAEPAPPPFPVALGAPTPLSLDAEPRGVLGLWPQGYNRVDGLALRWGLHYVPAREDPDAPRAWAQVVLRTSREDLGWEVGVERELSRRGLVLRLAGYDLTDTSERWHRGDVEASLAALFLGEDNRFYFDRRGVEARARQELRGPLAVDLALRHDDHDSVRAQDPFTVAADDFLPNPSIDEGTMRSVLAGATWDGRDAPDRTTRGWWARAEAEAAGGALGADFDFTAGRLEVRRYQPLGPHRLDVRLVLAGRIGGSLPLQKRFNLGGAATLPGYEALSVRGDRMALANLRYRIPIEGVGRLRPFQRIFQEGAWVTLLADAGRAWDSGEGDPDWLGSAGIGFAGRGTLNEVGVYLVVPSEKVEEDQNDVSLFLYFGQFF